MDSVLLREPKRRGLVLSMNQIVFHNVVSVEAKDIGETGNNRFYRDLVVTTADGQKVEIVLFSLSKDDLFFTFPQEKK